MRQVKMESIKKWQQRILIDKFLRCLKISKISRVLLVLKSLFCWSYFKIANKLTYLN